MSAFNQHLGELTEHFKEIESSETKLREKLEVVLCRAYRLQNRSNNSPFVPATRGEWNTLFFNPDLLDKKFVLSPDNVYIPTPAPTKPSTTLAVVEVGGGGPPTPPPPPVTTEIEKQKADLEEKYNNIMKKIQTESDILNTKIQKIYEKIDANNIILDSKKPEIDKLEKQEKLKMIALDQKFEENPNDPSLLTYKTDEAVAQKYEEYDLINIKNSTYYMKIDNIINKKINIIYKNNLSIYDKYRTDNLETNNLKQTYLNNIKNKYTELYTQNSNAQKEYKVKYARKDIS
jgi:hypothetical protein